MQFAETELHRRAARQLMMVIRGGRYFMGANTDETEGDSLSFSGLTFPLRAGSSLLDEETQYIASQRKAILALEEQTEKEITQGAGLEKLRQRNKNSKNLSFFLNHICKEENWELKIEGAREVNFSGVGTKRPIGQLWNSILGGDVVIVNQRVYPLVHSDVPSFVYLGGQNFRFGASQMTTDEIEDRFKEELRERTKRNCMTKSKFADQIARESEVLEAENDALIKSLGIQRFSGNYECGHLGFDSVGSLVYHLIPAHYNQTTSRSYEEGQSAAVTPLTEKDISPSVRFADRNSMNDPFQISGQSHCFGDCILQGNEFADKMYFLKAVANLIHENGAFYQVSNSSSDSGGY